MFATSFPFDELLATWRACGARGMTLKRVRASPATSNTPATGSTQRGQPPRRNNAMLRAESSSSVELRAPFAEGKPSKIRQMIRFLDNDRFQWVVSMQEGDGWKQLIDATWKRKK